MAGLTDKQSRFIDEYLIDLNATQAAIRAGYSERTAQEQGARLLLNVMVVAEIKLRMKAREERTEITQDMVLQRFWGIATADPRKLIEYRKACCRFCHGKGHNYQWINEKEWTEAVMKESRNNPDADEDSMPKNIGGYGFNKTLKPVADCPNCFGEGLGDAYIHDTRTIDEQTATLYAGVKITKNGLEVLMHDQSAALVNVAKHLGMFIERVEKGAVGDFEKLTDEQLLMKAKMVEKEIDVLEKSKAVILKAKNATTST